MKILDFEKKKYFIYHGAKLQVTSWYMLTTKVTQLKLRDSITQRCMSTAIPKN
jgi:hypothetical protein